MKRVFQRAWLPRHRLLFVAAAIVVSAVITSASSALGASSRAAPAPPPLPPCSYSATSMTAFDMECFWNTEMAPYNETNFQTASPVLGTPASVARAVQDQCFAGIGNPYPAKVGGVCPAGSLPKTNQTYTWGLTKAGTSVWVGTAPNMGGCISGGSRDARISLDGASSISAPSPGGTTAPPPYGYPTLSVCEFGDSQAAKRSFQPLPAQVGDWYMPHVYRYDTTNGALTDMSSGLATVALNGIIGLRSAGTSPGSTPVVFLGGPALSQNGGVRMVAYNGSTNRYIGSHLFSSYEDIRKWIVVGTGANARLYTAVGTLGPPDKNGNPTVGGGRLLLWTGTVNSPWSFREVGSFDADPAELTYYNGRIFVSTWGGDDGATPGALWMSPPLPASNQLPATTALMQKLWSTDQYEPDQQTKNRIGAGNLAAFNGWLYWGTMQEPSISSGSGSGGSGGSGGQGGHRTTSDRVVRALGAAHPLSIWRGQLVGSSFTNVQLLYGDASLPTDCGTANNCSQPGDNATKATLTTSLPGTNDDLTYTAVSYGSGGNAITVAYTNDGANIPLSVSVSGSAITVHLATNGSGNVTSTAAQVAAAIAASSTAAAKVTVANATGNDGSGVVSVMAPTNLSGGTSNVWNLVPNKFNGQQGLCGPGGFGNYYNNYTWTMAVHAGHLFVGTMDMRGQADGGNPTSASSTTSSYNMHLSENPRGADLWRFDAVGSDPNNPKGTGGCAVAESLDGLGNQLTTGIRTMISDGSKLWAGMATSSNLWSGNQGYPDALGIPNSGPGQVAS